MFRVNLFIQKSAHAFDIMRRETHGNQTLSILQNGLRILSLEHHGTSSGVGIFIKKGCANEGSLYKGVSSILKNCLLKDNKRERVESLSSRLASLGNSINFTHQREITAYMLQCPRYDVDKALNILSGATFYPINDEETFIKSKESTIEQLQLINNNPMECAFDLLHQASWGNSLNIKDNNGIIYPSSPIGHTEVPTENEIQSLSLSQIEGFNKTFNTPNRTVITGVGINNHDTFIESVIKNIEFPDSFHEVHHPSIIETANHYYGGQVAQHVTESPTTYVKFAEKPLSHVIIACKGLTINQPMQHMNMDLHTQMQHISNSHTPNLDYLPYAVIQTLMGGGTSFSAGGPGKGMHTKLFREVINREGWLHGVECVTAWYSDSGLVALYGQCPHDYAHKMVDILAYQIATINNRLNEQLWEMAKNQLLSQVTLLGESREILLEESGKMMLNHNKFLSHDQLQKSLETLSLNDLNEAVKAMFNHPPAVAIYGNTTNIQGYKTIHNLINKYHKSNN